MSHVIMFTCHVMSHVIMFTCHVTSCLCHVQLGTWLGYLLNLNHHLVLRYVVFYYISCNNYLLNLNHHLVLSLRTSYISPGFNKCHWQL